MEWSVFNIEIRPYHYQSMQRGRHRPWELCTKGMAEVLAAYNCALIADMFGDAPCSQAALIDENGSPVYLTPKMDKQEEIYTQAMQYLDDAIADLQKEDLIDRKLKICCTRVMLKNGLS